MSEEDQFMWLFGRVERLQQRLRVMIFIGNFQDHIRTIGPQLKAVISASMSIRNSDKLKKILEIILAFGNYMNSGKRGSVYGFKLTSLEALVETKSTDKSQNLLHYICNVVHSYFSDFADFMLEIRYVDQAAKVSLDQVIKDVADLKKGMETTKKEFETHQNQVLGQFLSEAGNKVEGLEMDAAEAQEAYRKCVTYFGETTKTMPPDTFFPMFDRFIKAYDKAENDLKKWELVQQKKIEKLQAVSIASIQLLKKAFLQGVR